MYLPYYISPISRLYLAYISPISPPQRKLEQMGGGLMETAQNATQLEVRHAQARPCLH
jgi:hypothetical protein